MDGLLYRSVYSTSRSILLLYLYISGQCYGWPIAQICVLHELIYSVTVLVYFRPMLWMADCTDPCTPRVDLFCSANRECQCCDPVCIDKLPLVYIYGLVQERCNSSSLAMELRLSRINPPICNFI